MSDDFHETCVTTPVMSLKRFEIAQLDLVVIESGRLKAHPLVSARPVVIGRGAQCDIVIRDPTVSRRHAVVLPGRRPTVRDLSSSNGTHVDGRLLMHGEEVPVRLNQTVVIGSVPVMLRSSSRSIDSWRIRTKEFFEIQLTEALKSSQVFSVVTLGIRLEQAPANILLYFSEFLGPLDVFASIGDGQYQLLLMGIDREHVDSVLKEMDAAGRRAGHEVALSASCHPGHGAPIRPARAVSKRSPERKDSPDLILEDPAMVRLYGLADCVAAGTISVLIVGETGAGKEILAEYIHHGSRANKPFLRLNCAALTESLLESELFGHEKGAFTGAIATKPGLLEAGSGGTVFLDEIGELPLPAQAKLLRVMEERTIRRVGGRQSIPIDVRFVTATNRDLIREVQQGNFREDLYYRVAGVTLTLPPLRERPSEIAALADRFVEETARRLGRTRPVIDQGAVEALLGHPWPGNIRQLRNVVERAVLLCRGASILIEHVELETIASPANPRSPIFAAPPSGMEDDGDRARIMEAMMGCGGNQTSAARLLGISRRTLGKWLERHGIPRPRKPGGLA